VNHRRFLRKRSPSPQDGPGGVLLPPVVVGGAAPSPSLPSEDTTAVAGETPIDTLSSGVAAATSDAAPVTSDSSTTSESSTESTSTEVQTIDLASLTAAPAATTIEQAKVTLTSEVDAPAETAPLPAQQGSLGKKNTALTVLIVVAASVGGVAIIWTIFRKWKLGRSDKFDKRLQPADWQPSERLSGDGGIGNGSSVHGHGSNHGHGGGLGPLPDHDFTAAAPVGGYADLARGATYNPQMQESTHRPNFGRYDV